MKLNGKCHVEICAGGCIIMLAFERAEIILIGRAENIDKIGTFLSVSHDGLIDVADSGSRTSRGLHPQI